MVTKKTNFSLNRKIITLLLVLQTLLLGVQAKNLIQQGDSAIEVMIWLINQCFPVLQRAKGLQDGERKGDK
ncbi:hypothetical protein [Anabaena sp. CCY 9402-a]|uniref:hypothetical protein n=1 Tax=Anabaena sp. CCY 9402-a TaxID=3103867 RepID=UPI0039C64AD0